LSTLSGIARIDLAMDGTDTLPLDGMAWRAMPKHTEGFGSCPSSARATG
jgi:hypothetical protein